MDMLRALKPLLGTFAAFLMSVAVPIAEADAQIPTTRSYTQAERLAMAQALTSLFPSLTVTSVDSPVINGDSEPLVFRISPSGNPRFGEFFQPQKFQFTYYPTDTFQFGSYFCRLSQEFVRERRRQNANFLPRLQTDIGIQISGVDISVNGARDLLSEIFYGVLYAWDYASSGYGRFRILVRGFADQSVNFSAPMPNGRNIRLDFLPTAAPPLLIYDAQPGTKTVGPNFGNADLPDLRADFIRRIVDAFLTSCRLEQALAPSAQVLEGAVIPNRGPQFRTFELFFYAYR